MYTKLQQIYEGKAKKVFATTDPDHIIIHYKDDALRMADKVSTKL